MIGLDLEEGNLGLMINGPKGNPGEREMMSNFKPVWRWKRLRARR